MRARNRQERGTRIDTNAHEEAEEFEAAHRATNALASIKTFL
jgi:hypothetical protein